MAASPYKTLCDLQGGLTPPNYNHLILHQIGCRAQEISPGPFREELAQVPHITHPFWICEAVISKDEAPKQELSWHQEQGLKLVIQQD